MATIAELAVNFTADTTKAETSVNRFTSVLNRFKTESEKTAYTANQEFGKMSKALETVGINGSALAGNIGKIGLAMAGLSAGASIAVLISQFEKSVQSAAHLQDVAEKTGASVEKLSAISTIAKIQGTDMELLSSAMVKLGVNMEATGGPSKTVSDSLARIGLSARDLKGLDTGSMFELISRKMGEYSDSAGKTAVAVALFGKRGAEIIPTMNLLAESGSLVAKTTAEQALQADAYEKNVMRLQLSKDALYKTISLSLLPTVNAFITAMIDVNNETDGARKAVKGMAEDGTLKEWATAGGYALAVLADGFGGVAKAAMTVAMTISTPISSMFQYLNGNVDAAAKKLGSFRERMDELWGGKSFVTRFGEKLDNADAGSGSDKKTISGGNTGAIANSAGDSFIQSLRDRLIKGISGEYAQLLQQAEEKNIKNIAAPLIEQLRALDESKALDNYRRNLELSTQEYRNQISQVGMTKDQIELMNVDQKMTIDLQKQIEQIERTKGTLTAETRAQMEAQKDTAVETIQALIRTRQTAEQSFGGGATHAINTYLENANNVGKQVESTFTNAFTNMENALVQFTTTGKLNFTNFANGIISDVMRIYIRMAITGLIGRVAGAFAGNVSGTGYTSVSPSGAGTYNYAGSEMTIATVQAMGGAWQNGVQMFAKGGIVGGPTLFPMANGAGLMGEAGPEAIMPLSRGSDGKLGVRSAGGGSVVQVNIVNQAAADGYRASASQSTDSNGKDIIAVVIEKVKGAMNQDVRNNGQFSQLLANKYGLRPSM